MTMVTDAVSRAATSATDAPSRARAKPFHSEFGMPRGDLRLAGARLGPRRVWIERGPQQGLIVSVAPKRSASMRHTSEPCQQGSGQCSLGV